MANRTLVILAMLLLTVPQLAVAEKCKLHAVEHAAPRYPAVAASTSVSGVVHVIVTVDEAGIVTDATVRSGHELLNAAALEAAKRWKFSRCTRTLSAELIFRFEVGKPGETGVRLEPLYKAPFTVIVKTRYPQDNVQ
jgi:TonB family protein